MVGVLIRMRWRLTLRSMSSGRASVAFWLGVVIGLIAAIISAGLLAAAGFAWDARAATNAAAALYAVWTLGWICGPILTGSSDETLQPEHFRLLPLSYRQLAIGLLAAAFTGPSAIVNLIAFGGLILLGTQFGVLPALFAVVGTFAQLVFVVVLSRVLLAWIGAAMRSRRGKDLGVVLAAMTGLAYYPLQLLISYVAPRLEHASRPVALALRIPPSGWAPYAVEAAANGQWWWSLAAVGGLALLSVLLWQAWAVLLRRRLTTPEAAAGQVRTNVDGGVLDRLFPADPLGAVVIKELRTWWRDSRRRAALLPLMLIGIVVPIFLSLQHNQGALPFAGAFVVWMAAMASANMYAFDGTAIWQTLVIPGAIRADVRGRMLAWVIIVAPFGLLLTLILPGAVGMSKLYPWGLATLPVLLGVGIATAIYLSVYAAYPLPQQRGNPFGGGGANPGCSRALVQLVVGLGQIILCAPVIVVLGIGSYLHNWVVQWLGVPVGIAVGAGAAVVAARVVEKRVAARGPELLAEVKPR
ncbi:ABC-2 type transport system permease protein [Nocardia pseudobrasiliensis]|uniref:ABC-2 type transport system permease protein n=2 Tax=Nocardia pseudobrasiliensis TaxID=45979 RepID=A0A370I921_9NOCA|nr:ABC-2 type transport system permease protein [Nocardia pseudobrasiliensis]